MIRNTIRYK